MLPSHNVHVCCVFCHRWLLFGFCPRGLPTDRPMWSDESGLQECTKGNTQPPSPQWSWVGGLIPTEPARSLYLTNKYLTCSPPTTPPPPHPPQTVFQVSEWAVDFGVQGGTDSEGWQYAADFPMYVAASGHNQHSRRRV